MHNCEEVLTNNKIEKTGKEIKQGEWCFRSSFSLCIKKPRAGQHGTEEEMGAKEDSRSERWKKTAGLGRSLGFIQRAREGMTGEGGRESLEQAN